MKASLYVHLEEDDPIRVVRVAPPLGKTYPRLEVGELMIFPTVEQLAQLRAAIDSYLPTRCPCAHCTAKRSEPCPSCGMDVVPASPCPTCGTRAKEAEVFAEGVPALNGF